MSTRRLTAAYDRTPVEVRAAGREWYDRATVEALDLLNLQPSATATLGNLDHRGAGLSRASKVGDLNHRAAVAVLAALSPRLQWSVNVQASRRLVAAWHAGDPVPPPVGLPLSRERAWHALELAARGDDPFDALGGRKVTAFAAALAGDPDAVVLDVWAIRAYRGGNTRPQRGEANHDANITPQEFRDAEIAYRRAAALRGETPRDFQAIIWIQTRGKAE